MKRLVFLAICAWLFLLFPGCKSALAGHSVTLEWTSSPDAGVTYNIYRAAVSCPTSGIPSAPTKIGTGINLLTYTDSAVSVGSTYCYYATASLSGLESVPSNTVQAVILPSPPTALVVASTK